MPSYEQKTFGAGQLSERLHLLASSDGRENSVVVHQDVSLYGARLAAGHATAARLADGRRAWLQVNGGAVRLADVVLRAGDGAALDDASEIEIVAEEDAGLLLFDLP
jgi:redox-sensitive bicupin YhaK (pirin superfamily)